MAQVIRVCAPENTSLEKMSEPEIRKLATLEVGKFLSALPPGVRPIGVNALSISSNPRVGTGSWLDVSWSKTCDDMKNQIIDYVDPGPEEIAELTAATLAGKKFVSSLTTINTVTPQAAK